MSPKNFDLETIRNQLLTLQVLVRTNNLLLSRFILELNNVKKSLNIPKRQTFFKFEILDEDYKALIDEFGKYEVDKALYKLDRLLLTNKQECPNNIAKFIRRRLKINVNQRQSKDEE